MATRAAQAAAAVDAARAALEALDGLERAPHAEVADLLGHAAELSRVVDAMTVRLAAEVSERSSGPADQALCRKLGYRSAREAIAGAFGIRARQAGDVLALAHATTADVAVSGGEIPAPFPRVADALGDGALSLEQARTIVDLLAGPAERAHPDDLAWAEGALVDAATHETEPLGPELLATQARAYAAVLDPDGVLPEGDRQRAMRSVRMGKRRDGMWQLTLVCTPEQGATVKAVLDAHGGPRVAVRFHDEACQERAASGTVGEQGDQGDHGSGGAGTGASTGPASLGAGSLMPDGRTRAQLQCDALVAIVQAAAGDAPLAALEPPTLVIHGSIDALTAAIDGAEHRERTARIEHTGDLIPIEHVQRLLCDAVIQPLVLDRDDHDLRLGRRQRLFSRHQRRALGGRDRGCRAPGCSFPPAWCEAHHVQPWSLGGTTDIDNAILLCSFHHHEVHDGRLRIDRDPRGGWLVVPQFRIAGPRRRTGGRAAGIERVLDAVDAHDEPAPPAPTGALRVASDDPRVASCAAAPALAAPIRDHAVPDAPPAARRRPPAGPISPIEARMRARLARIGPPKHGPRARADFRAPAPPG